MQRLVYASLLGLCRLLAAQITPNYEQFVTRPDISAPKWRIVIYDSAALTPGGYWFVAPYMSLIQNSWPKWNGPMIYDTNGQLIWSGAPFVKYDNTFDFRMSYIDGKQVLTLIWPKNTEHQEGGIILDNTYQVTQVLDMRGDHQIRPNMHDLNLIDDGKRALMLTMPYQNESHVVVPGEFDGPCKVQRQGFKELDRETGEVLFEWNSEDHINVDETTYFQNAARKYEENCDSFWDITHFNAVDKFDDGHYLLSSRHTDTLYKVSSKDGKIIWRLNGRNSTRSDFVFKDERAIFSRQHHARFRGQNSTHTLVSLFDNSVGDYPALASAYESWGLVLALRTDVTPMTAELVTRFQRPFIIEHPREKARGSVQFLDWASPSLKEPYEESRPNVFVGWITGSQIGEYTFDGRLLMHAEFIQPEPRSYRCYKMPWVGRPAQPPDVVAKTSEKSPGKVATTVHVSWNGDTEAATWCLLHTDRTGDISELVTSAPRHGFETKLEVDGFLRNIVVVALDAKGAEIGRSDVVHITLSPDLGSPSIVAEEQHWLDTHTSAWHATEDTFPPVTSTSSQSRPPISEAISTPYTPLAVFCSVVGALAALYWVRRRRRRRRSQQSVYESVANEEDELEQYDEVTYKQSERQIGRRHSLRDALGKNG